MQAYRLTLILVLVCCFVVAVYSQKPGGLIGEKPADEHLEGIMKKAMQQIQESYPGGFKSIDPVSYRTQVVAGTNYFIKAKVTEMSGKVKNAHIRLYRHWKGDIQVHGVKTDVTESSPLEFF